MPEEKQLRFRVNVSTSTRGVKTWDCTVEGTNFPQDEVLHLSDQLVAKLEKRYPIKIEGE